MRNFFQRQGKFRPRHTEDQGGDQNIPEDLWVKCPQCGELIYSRELDRNAHVCPKCGHHFRLRARQRIDLLADPGTFVEWDTALRPDDPLQFVDGQGPYNEKILKTQQKTGESEALITGECLVDGRQLVLVVADFNFLGASMGSVWGEKMSRAVERAIERRLPVLTVNASGGARMHEGLFSLMQMAKTVASFELLGKARLPHFSLLVDPCYGGVTASYATIADVILAEPGAKIGFAGQRVIEQAIKQKLPKEFQTAEFMLEHGTIDLIVGRQELKQKIATLIDHYCPSASVMTRSDHQADTIPVAGNPSQDTQDVPVAVTGDSADE
ncbi:MAG TPA: acetyl-CoA carboxylase, carboxyltransferase subunit beta [Thermomicrobiales bacterium]|nr:acetyl-CoA carboxylase, carboxyltransferase subunit beta [Thermomicrobiales bacterium]